MCFLSITGDKNSILELREELGVSYHRSFPGCQLIDWLLQNSEAESRRQGLELCCALQEHGIIQHGEESHHLLFEVCCQSEAASLWVTRWDVCKYPHQPFVKNPINSETCFLSLTPATSGKAA